MATLSTAPVCRKPAPQPARGMARLVKPIGETLATPGEIEINGKRYLIGRFEGGYRLGTFDAKKGVGVQYDVNFLMDHCDCPDYTFRARLCKHCLALAALWKAGKLS